MPAESLPVLDLNNIVVLGGTAVGTAVAVFIAYFQKKKPGAVSSSQDIVLPAATIASVAPIAEPLHKIAACLGEIHDSLKDWREVDEDRRRERGIEQDAFDRGRIYAEEKRRREEEEQRRLPAGRRRPNTD